MPDGNGLITLSEVNTKINAACSTNFTATATTGRTAAIFVAEFGPNTTNIVAQAFQSTGVIKVNLPTGLTTIQNRAFYTCTQLTEITIPEGVTTLPFTTNGIFQGCTALREVYLPASLTSIENNTFNGCNALVKVTSMRMIPPTLGATTPFPTAATIPNCTL
jgi:hypothetical protein